jgi:hypothetical protein
VLGAIIFWVLTTYVNFWVATVVTIVTAVPLDSLSVKFGWARPMFLGGPGSAVAQVWKPSPAILLGKVVAAMPLSSVGATCDLFQPGWSIFDLSRRYAETHVWVAKPNPATGVGASDGYPQAG